MLLINYDTEIYNNKRDLLLSIGRHINKKGHAFLDSLTKPIESDLVCVFKVISIPYSDWAIYTSHDWKTTRILGFFFFFALSIPS